MDMYEHLCTFMDEHVYVWIFMDVYGHLWIYMDVYGQEHKKGWMCQNRLELIIMSGIDLKWVLNSFDVIINGLAQTEII